MIEYAQVTRSSNGTIDCIGQMTSKTYKNTEYIEDSGVDAPPVVGDIGLVLEIHNDEFVWIGRLKQNKSSLQPEEYRIHQGSSHGMIFEGIGTDGSSSFYKADVTTNGNSFNKEYSYTIRELFSIDKDGNILIQRKDTSGGITSSIKLSNSDDIEIANTNASITVLSDGTMNIVSTNTINVTSPTINLN